MSTISAIAPVNESRSARLERLFELAEADERAREAARKLCAAADDALRVAESNPARYRELFNAARSARDKMTAVSSRLSVKLRETERKIDDASIGGRS